MDTGITIKSEIKKMYDGTASKYGEEYKTPAGKYFMWRKIKTILRLGGFKEGDNILEVGCANGAYTFEFSKLGFKMTGLDLSEQNILEAQKRSVIYGISNISFIVGDAENMNIIPNESFDGVLSISALRYVPNPQKAINEMYRIMKNNKKIIIDFPNKYSPWFNYIKPMLTGKKHIHDHSYSSKEIRHMLQEAGFENIETKTILFTAKATPEWLLGLMKGVDYIFERLPLINQFAGIVVCKGTK